MKFLVLLASLALGANASATGAERDPIGSLSRARAVFERIDADGDQSLSTDETTSIGVPETHFERHDTDGDLCMSREEFSVYYYYLLLTAAEGVEGDLADEVARLRALRLASDEEAQADAQPRPGQKKPRPGQEEPRGGQKKPQVADSAAQPSGDRESLENARQLLLRLVDEEALSQESARDFRRFFWGKKSRALDPAQAAPAYARASRQVQELFASKSIGRKQAKLLRTTLELRAGPAIVEAASAEPEMTAPEPMPLPLMIDEGTVDGTQQGSIGVELPDLDVDMTATPEELLDPAGETSATGETAVDEAFIGPLQWSETPEGQAAAEAARESVDANESMESVSEETDSGDWEDLDAPLEVLDSVEDESAPVTEPETAPQAERTFAPGLPENVEPVQESVAVGLPEVEVNVSTNGSESASDLPFYMSDVEPPSAPQTGSGANTGPGTGPAPVAARNREQATGRKAPTTPSPAPGATGTTGTTGTTGATDARTRDESAPDTSDEIPFEEDALDIIDPNGPDADGVRN